MPFFAERRVILIEGSDWFKKSSDEAVKCIESVPESCVIIFTERNVDKRLVVVTEADSGIPGLSVGDLLDDGSNRMVKPYSSAPCR